MPEHDSRDRQIALIVFLLSFGYLCLFRRYTTIEPDEGIVLQGAQRVLGGQVLYRDFFSYFTPGSYYSLALLFTIFGSSFMVARYALAVMGGIFSAVAYLLIRRVCSTSVSVFLALVVTLTTLPFRFVVLHNWDSTLWTCLAVYCAVRTVESPRAGWAMGVGSFVSLCSLFEQSKGAGLCLGLGIGLLVIGLRDQQLYRLRLIVAVAIGLAWPVLLTIIYFNAQHSLSVMFSDWFWPLRHYSGSNHVPYGYQDWPDNTREELFRSGPKITRLITALALSPAFLIPMLPLLGIGIGAYWIFRFRRSSHADPKCRYYVLTCFALAGLLLSVIVGRADILHFVYLLPLFSLPLAWVMDGRDIYGQLFQRIRPFLNAYIVVAFLLFASPLFLRSLISHSEAVTRRGNVMMPTNDSVITYIQARIATGGSMLVYPYLPLYYYLTATFNPTRYDYFQPGMNTPQQANEILSGLKSNRNLPVLFESSFVEKIPRSWPGTPLTEILRDPVTDYIIHEYHTCKILSSPSNWKFFFMVRKDLECP